MKVKKVLATALIVSMAAGLMGCSVDQTAATGAQSAGNPAETAETGTGTETVSNGEIGIGETAGEGEKSLYGLPDVGETLHGFTVTERGSIDRLNAETASFIHEKSGLTLFLIENEDPELAFQICYRTPQQDGTDVPHIFEHSIIAGSDKYPGTDVFFDLSNKSYSTYANANTYPCFTRYPVASTSEAQLQKMMDVYMSCMEAPAVLKDERIFKREALRYQLYDKNAPIELTGTVFAEDQGNMTQTGRTVLKGIFDFLYPDTVAANFNGFLWDNYQDLAFDKLQEVYDAYYSYDNALIVLYGKLDYDKQLAFLDENYLGDEEKQGKNAISEFDLEPVEGFHKGTIEIPAYEGSTVKDQAMILYAVDLSEYSEEELFELQYFSAFVNMESSPFKKKLKEAGIYNSAGLGNIAFGGLSRPVLYFELDNANPEDAEPFYEVVQDSLKEIGEKGFSESLVDSAIHGLKLQEALSLDTTNIGVDSPVGLISHFVLTGETDFYAKSQEARDAVYADESQEIMRGLAGKLMNPTASCLVTGVPTPGLAEEKDAEREEYLARMKENMTDAELDQLIEDTLAFDDWNNDPVHNNDFMIDPRELPDPERLPDVARSESDGIRFMSVPALIHGAGGYELIFDTSSLSQNELFDLKFYTMSLCELDTRDHSHEEIAERIAYYMSNLSFDLDYPGEAGSPDHRPMLTAHWCSMTDDLAPSVNLLLEIMRETDFSDADAVLGVIDKYRENYNPATTDAFDTASDLSSAYLKDSFAYSSYLNGPGYYSYLKDLEEKLTADEGYAAELEKRMQALVQKAIGRKDLIFAVTAESDKLSDLEATALAILKELPENDVDPDVRYDIEPESANNVAVYVDSASQYAVKRYDFGAIPEMKGRYYPFLAALSDIYVVPLLRYQYGAYSVSLYANAFLGRAMVYSYSDPNVSKTIGLLDDLAVRLDSMELTEEEFKGYIANAYSQATAPQGMLSKGFSAIGYELEGWDMEAAYERVSDVRNADLGDLRAAAECLKEAENQFPTVMAGNRKLMEPEASVFDLILDYQE